ncbi:MAG: ABC transporter permease [Legionella sp.]|nr:ABC transporter permease [Legionella sp.]
MMNNIISTLIIKDIKSRFSGEKLAYCWDLINPLAWIGALIVLFSVIGKQVPIYTDIISFLIPGMLAYILFRNTIKSVMRSRKTSQSILHIQSISSDIVIAAAALVELLNGLVIFLVIVMLNYIFFDKFECNDLLIMVLGYLFAWCSGLAIGSFTAELSNLYPMVEKLLPILLRPLFWFSGVFYTANELPEWLSDLGSMNPLFQSIEMIRDGTFFCYHSRMSIYYQPVLFFMVVLGLSYLIRIHKQTSYG